MEYHITVAVPKTRKRIASFVQETDRDICFDALVGYWGEENEFEKEDD
jgi:hypothetical protein